MKTSKSAVGTSFRPRLLASLTVLICLTCHSLVSQSPPAPNPAVPSDTGKTKSSVPSADASRANTEPLQPWQVLSAGANSRNALRRAEAFGALGTLAPTPRVVRLIETGLEDKDPSIRQLAAGALGEMHARSAIPRLREALNDDSAEVSFAAAKSLWNMGDRAGREVFIEILSGEKSSSGGLIKDQFQATKKKFQDPKGLAVIGAKEAATSLFGPAGWGIKVMEEVTADRSASARAMSAILLGPDATLDSLRQLQNALNDRNWIVRAPRLRPSEPLAVAIRLASCSPCSRIPSPPFVTWRQLRFFASPPPVPSLILKEKRLLLRCGPHSILVRRNHPNKETQ